MHLNAFELFWMIVFAAITIEEGNDAEVLFSISKNILTSQPSGSVMCVKMSKFQHIKSNYLIEIEYSKDWMSRSWAKNYRKLYITMKKWAKSSKNFLRQRTI